MSAEFLLLFGGESSGNGGGPPSWQEWIVIAIFILIFLFCIFGLVMTVITGGSRE